MPFDINTDPNYQMYLQKVSTLNAFDAAGLRELMIQYLCYQATIGSTLNSNSVANNISLLVATADQGSRLF